MHAYNAMYEQSFQKINFKMLVMVVSLFPEVL